MTLSNHTDNREGDEVDVARAQAWQRRGLTVSEIAARMGVKRDAIVAVLYPYGENPVTEAVEPSEAPKAPYAGKLPPRVRLRAGDGRWLHMSGEGLTLIRADAWIGTPEQLFRLREKNATLNAFTVSQA